MTYVLTELDKSMIETWQKMSIITDISIIKAYFKIISAQINSTKMADIWSKIFDNFRKTPPYKYCKPDFYKGDILQSPSAFAAYLNNQLYDFSLKK